jgi:2-oxoglutarate dehydrogenase E1 component
MIEDDAIDWATGELLAMGSLLMDGHPVRLVGQDTRRGTFGQRHAVLVDRKTGEEYTPLKQFGQGVSKFYVHDSLLSEYAAMGFEYGYSMTRPDALVAWEAQFGDFANGAQSVVDEYISSGEQKWGQRSSLVLLLPHGYEGQGPDHSSARIERYLQLCAQDNMTVAYPTTPANYFHLLRWQVLSSRGKPLVVFTPKSLLRLKAATSPVEQITDGAFQPVIPEVNPAVDPAGVKRVLLTTGKIYYDVAKARDAAGANDTAVVRVERLYPPPVDEIKAELAKYPAGVEVVFVQDEPANMGAWPFMALKLPHHIEGLKMSRVSRPASSSPAVGSAKLHQAEQEALLSRLF